MYLRYLTSLCALAVFATSSSAQAVEANGANVTVPDTGSTALLLGAVLVGAALGARRFLKK